MRALLFVTLLLAACQATTATPAATASPAETATPTAAPTQVAAVLPSPTATPKLPTGKVTVAGHAVAVDIAETYDSRRQGLSTRPSLAKDTGLVLAWDSPQQVSIWMPDMNFPIDVIFVRNAQVVYVEADAQPCPDRANCPTFGPSEPVDYVLEVPAGSAKTWGVKVGSAALLSR